MHKFAMKLALLSLMFGISAAVVSVKESFADVGIKNSGPDLYLVTLTISNTISQKDAETVAHIDFRGKSLEVYLDSPGGSVDAALKIGRVVRANNGWVHVWPRAKCFSSCALIYIAGTHRTNNGIIGLHRPYLSAAPMSQQEIERQVPLMLHMVKDYVQTMGVTDSFYQEMANTEPSNMQLYRGDQILKLVSEYDATQEEIRVSYMARSHGIDTAEWRQRELEVTDKCGWIDRELSSIAMSAGTSDARIRPLEDQFFRCSAAVEWGLSESVYEKRIKIADQCKLSDADLETIKGMDKGVVRESPLVLKHEACVRNIMLSPAR
jgi:hypothetical protein